MTNEARSRSFDYVQSMPEIRNRINAEIADMTYAELSRWLDARVSEGPLLGAYPEG